MGESVGSVLADQPAPGEGRGGWRPLWGSLKECERCQGDKAQTSLRELLRLQPDLSVAWLKTFFGIANPGFLDRLLEGLRKAGWEPQA